MDAPPRDDVLLVDDQDRPLRTADKAESHRGRGARHRAFTLLVLDRDGRLLLARRAAAKPLWAHVWDGTVASHPRPGEGYVEAARRRLPEELVLADGPPDDVAVLNRFAYRADDEAGAENEVCATIVTVVDAQSVVRARAEEISELRWIDAEEFAAELERAPRELCPWLLIALEFVARGRWTAPPGAVADLVDAWRVALDAERLAHAVTHHRVDAPYTLLDEPPRIS